MADEWRACRSSQRRRWTSNAPASTAGVRPTIAARVCSAAGKAPAPVGGCVVQPMPACAVRPFAGHRQARPRGRRASARFARAGCCWETRPAVRGAAVQSPRGQARVRRHSPVRRRPATRTRCRCAWIAQPRAASITADCGPVRAPPAPRQGRVTDSSRHSAIGVPRPARRRPRCPAHSATASTGGAGRQAGQRVGGVSALAHACRRLRWRVVPVAERRRAASQALDRGVEAEAHAMGAARVAAQALRKQAAIAGAGRPPRREGTASLASRDKPGSSRRIRHSAKWPRVQFGHADA